MSQTKQNCFNKFTCKQTTTTAYMYVACSNPTFNDISFTFSNILPSVSSGTLAAALCALRVRLENIPLHFVDINIVESARS